MTTLEVGKQLVELCKQGKNHEAMTTLYSPDIISIEAATPTSSTPTREQGLEKALAKGEWWNSTFEVHSAEIEGPFPNGERFIVRFKYDVTAKSGPTSGHRMTMDEAGLYTVKDGKITEEEFFYTMGG